MDAYDQFQETGARSDIFDAFGEPRDYWVRSTRERRNRVYPTKPLIGFILNKTKLNGGWGEQSDAAARLHNSGYIIVDQNDQPIEPAERYKHLMNGADRIRLCALNYFIEPAREQAAREVSIRAQDLATAMGLKDVFPNICQALGGGKFQTLAQVPPPKSTDPNPSSSTVFTYTLNSQPEADPVTDTKRKPSPSALNTILYGPPGTGKTYATFRKAVEICDGAEAVAAMDGPTLKARYTELREAGRIGFVTFHQSYSYEEFVEGLRPEGGAGEAGFTLEPRNGALREIASLAALHDCRSSDTSLLTPHDAPFSMGERAVFKVAIQPLMETANIVGNDGVETVALTGQAGMDLSDPRFDQSEEILQAYKKASLVAETAKWSERSVETANCFRNKVQIGDIVLVTKNNKLIQAIGEVTGPYSYHEEAQEGGSHRRNVRWLRMAPRGIPIKAVYDGRLDNWPINRLAAQRIDNKALEALINGNVSAAAVDTPFVLVMDEINRANISKVFGELITLLEEDKRAGAENEVAVRLPYSGDLFTLPANLHFLGTMNTADRSIALLDTALRRRFHFEETPPMPTLLGNIDGIDLSLLLTRLNQRIEYLVDRDHLIGHAFFMGCQSRADIDTVMRRKVLPLLAEYFHEDWERIVAVLGGEAQGFIAKDTLDVPPGLDLAMDGPRYRYTVRDTFPENAYAGLQA
ncbi:5-methylcytosine-specific restriction enzyme B [Tropicibacter naphthalenivorans]|uniref:5-methylcytosine-specific restriction enzyme B n=2 Tax=Tropicibacter naphthalenivorans TaxID=441103 RepID=A0A0P1GJ97_9RHOB|nr:5-methylcytosine-specific restriction enzyme B [Tropicibacter naphthalenivorans]SMD07881.1 5-methylcytosine-specific restriction enzyme B [Tropicibacter naphthalenivorans]